MGCRKVTEKSLYYLKSMTNLKTVDMRGTDVGIVPPDLKGIVKTVTHYANMPMQYAAILKGCKKDNF